MCVGCDVSGCFDIGNSSQMNNPRCKDQVLDGHVVETLTKINALPRQE